MSSMGFLRNDAVAMSSRYSTNRLAFDTGMIYKIRSKLGSATPMLLRQAQHRTLHVPLARWRGWLNFPMMRRNDRSIAGLLILFVEGASSLHTRRFSIGILAD